MKFRYEAIVYKKSYKSLQSQLKYLLDNGKKLYDNYGAYRMIGKEMFWDELMPPTEEFRIAMGIYDTAYIIKGDIKKQLLVGYKTAYTSNIQKIRELGVAFDVQNPVLEEYMVDWRKLQLSERDGSIARTTKKNVADVLQTGIREGQSRTEVSKNIRLLEPTIFSKSRAELIAVQETGQAFGYGNRAMMDEVKKQGGVIIKKRSTVKDARVRESHRQNEADGRIPFDQEHSGTGELYAPSAQFRCRCTSLFELK